MFSPLNDPTVADWFRHLDTGWRRLPANEQARQREEVQQHLEGLVAAKTAQGQSSEDAWKNSLVQFGDPTQIGRKMYNGWRLSKTGFRAEMNRSHNPIWRDRMFHLPKVWPLWTRCKTRWITLL